MQVVLERLASLSPITPIATLTVQQNERKIARYGHVVGITPYSGTTTIRAFWGHKATKYLGYLDFVIDGLPDDVLMVCCEIGFRG
jgi:hypothetical protein